ncbi:processed acidic surface protein [Bacillus alkalicellulosilyticus]|uniref:processed acidic surface protein n=1 Tax=Alkalihalobacterium alkalicellulosilyticum TaxID=1912214 RepID=UPI0009964D1F|nr:processed acidic surface protein [Bacillus alkalicellulosilyticus]
MKKVLCFLLVFLLVMPGFSAMAATPITDDSLNELAASYDITVAEIDGILAQYGESTEDFETIEDIVGYLEMDEEIEEVDFDEFFELLVAFDITEEEFLALLEHVSALDPVDLEERLIALLDRVEALPDFESAVDLTDAHVEELAAIWGEFLDIFQMQAEYYMISEEDYYEISLRDLLYLESTNGYDLLIELYNYDGEFLADILITADMFGSDIIKEVSKEVVEAPTAGVDKTVKGGKLPKTATNSGLNMLLALFAMAVGFGVYRKGQALR